MSVATLPNPTATSVSAPSRTPPPKVVVPALSKIASRGIPFQAPFSLRLWSVDEYERMVSLGLLGEDDPVELLEGFLVLKMPHNNSHDRGIRKMMTRLVRIVPAGWTTQCQCSVVFDTSKPEPDFSICRGDDSIYDQRQPRAADVALIIEVSDSSPDRDRRDKSRTYGRAGVPVYWVVNMIDGEIEVYSDPTGDDDEPKYRTIQTYRTGDAVPLVLDGQTVGTLAVDELI